MYYKNLDVYKRAYAFGLEVHIITKTFPAFERYELASQLRRAGISIVLNITEGYGRRNKGKELKQFLRIALGSNDECEVLITICRDLGYLEKDKFDTLLKETRTIGVELIALIKSIDTTKKPIAAQ